MTNRTYKQREKMICSILLLITLTSCVSGSFVVNVRQSSYQAEENHNITLEWTFSPRTDGSSKSIFIFCELLTDLGPFALFDLHKDLEVPQSQHEWFSGRVQFDKDVLREGRLRLHMSRLRTADSGLYLCRVNIGYGWNSGQCRLNVTARDRPKPETPNTASGGRDVSKTGSPSEPESLLLWIVFYCGLGLGLLVAGLLLGVCYRLFRHSRSERCPSIVAPYIRAASQIDNNSCASEIELVNSSANGSNSGFSQPTGETEK
ncbi:uncharacterized protein LOC129093652 isoform X2 [Anoplopoma fimbria]|uniref:uncharacterized protein LOC129093652 isoform X2 n=1 Tax=Anoplopoma fimbria TaxID=229290 RepID=UPI0023EC09B9|nr:uncharacterized protein LOC129093652 isoform X2 [Anoplopoma fimbria]